MPLVDMPIDKLKEYQGRSPHPTDFDEYWERALAEMKAVNSQLELVPSEFQVPGVECYHLYFTGVRGARIHAKYLRPAGEQKPHRAVLQFHGYSGNCGPWIDKLAYVHQGYSVFALDCRGQGGLSEDTGGVKGNTHHGHIIRGLDSHEDDLLFRHIFLDTAQLAHIAMSMPEVDKTEVYAMGGSQGGALTIACAALVPEIKKLAPVYPFLSDYKRVWEMDLAQGAYQELKTYFMRFDPRHLHEDEMFYRLGYIDIQFLAPRIKGEVLMGVGLMDTICPPSTQFAAYNKITAPKRLEIYPDFGHVGLPGFSELTLEFFQQK